MGIDEILSRGFPLNEAEARAITAIKTAEIIAENATLRERIRALEAGIEEAAVGYDRWARLATSQCDEECAEANRAKAARLRALLK